MVDQGKSADDATDDKGHYAHTHGEPFYPPAFEITFRRQSGQNLELPRYPVQILSDVRHVRFETGNSAFHAIVCATAAAILQGRLLLTSVITGFA